MIPSTMDRDSTRLDELVAGWVLGDLSDEEQRELDGFDAVEVASRIERTERAAAKLLLTFESDSSRGLTQVPESIQALLRKSIDQAMESSARGSVVLAQSAQSAFSPRELAAWFLAVAASVLALISWIPLSNKPNAIASLSDQRARLLAEEGDVIQAKWQQPTDDASIGRHGDVVWSTRRQEGYMLISGLAKNDPTKEQYQLWIFDPARDTNPVDGGVFDVSADGDVIVPIQSKLAVSDPTLFAITMEKPGGVVVSDKSRLPLLAKVVR